MNLLDFIKKLQNKLEKVADNLNGEFPNAKEMSRLARSVHEKIFDDTDAVINNPDEILCLWLSIEYELFCIVEEKIYGKKVRRGFNGMREFLDTANSVMNRRKVRAGKSLECHLAAIFTANRLPFSKEKVTEKNKKPDFIFPSIDAYHNPEYDSDKLIVLAAKTTCKDRWRQILNEADRRRDKVKYLFTLQSNISSKQLFEMKSENVVLVVPKRYIENYPKEFQTDILSLSKFIRLVKKTVLNF